MNIQGDHIFGSRQFWISLSMTLIIPLSFLRRLDSLKYTSCAALFGILYLVVLVVFSYFSKTVQKTSNSDVFLFHPQLSFLSYLPIFVFAFTCHQNIFTIFNELKNNNATRMNSIISTSILSSMVVYWVVGTLGYLMFGELVCGNILKCCKFNLRGVEG